MKCLIGERKASRIISHKGRRYNAFVLSVCVEWSIRSPLSLFPGWTDSFGDRATVSFKQRLKELLDTYSDIVSLHAMGFPHDWMNEKMWE